MKNIMNKNKITVAISSLVLAVSILHTGQALAQTSLAQEQVSASQAATKGKLTQIGSPNGVMTPLKGFAKDLPLITVIRQITPNGWVVKKSDNEVARLDTQMLVSWQGGSNWVETLGTIIDGYPLNANINWDKKEITLMALENKIVAKTMIFELENSLPAVNNVSQVTVGASEQTKTVVEVKEVKVVSVVEVKEVKVIPVVEVKEVKVIPVVEVRVVTPEIKVMKPVIAPWMLDSKKSLKENVESWATSSGYRLVWLGEDYSVEDRALSGNFDDENGPIKQLSIDYGPKSRVQQPLSFQFFQNATLVVENWKFEQLGYPQYGSKK